MATKNTTANPNTIDETLKAFTTKSAQVRYLDSQGWTRGAISKKLDIRYQHVRNVLITPVAKPKA